MADEHIALLKQNYAALNRAYETGDFEAFRREIGPLTAPGFVMATSGQWVEHGEWQGIEGTLEFVHGQLEALEAARIEIDGYDDRGSHIVATGRFGGRARETGIAFEVPIVHVWLIRDGQIVRLQMARDEETALKAAGL